MTNDEWEMFGMAIKLYSAGKITRDGFCKIWECAQQTNAFIDYCHKLEVIAND